MLTVWWLLPLVTSRWALTWSGVRGPAAPMSCNACSLLLSSTL